MKHEKHGGTWLLVLATALAGCSDASRESSLPMAPALDLEGSPSQACAQNLTWFRNGHLDGSFSAPSLCWEYSGGAHVDVIATYSAASGAGHFNGESHRWYMKTMDHLGGRSSDSTFLKQAYRNADTWYADTLDVTLPTSAGEGVAVYLLFEDEDDYNFWIEIYTVLSPPSNLDASLTGETTASLSWQNAESGPSLTTQVYRSANGGAWALDTTVASGASSLSRQNLGLGSTYRYEVRHRSPYAVSVAEYTRLSGYSNIDSVTTLPPPPTAAISGPTTVKKGDSCLWHSQVTDGAPPFSYEWWRDSALFIDPSLVGTSSNLVMQVPGPSFTLTLIVTDSLSRADTATYAVTVSGGGACP